ncbi:MAG: radical SAM protein [Deltaproteobacteria bacterium]|nr:radical SAM protein [Deltaproteobacteria bacterium]
MSRPSRNAPCPCGSGLKYKHCCGRTSTASPRPRIPSTPDRRRKLVLAFPPYTTAASPPLGVCHLKAYVERTLPQWSVRVLDLNLEAHEHFLETLPSSTASLPPGVDRESVLRAAQMYRGAHPQDFHDKVRYLRLTQAWARTLPDALVDRSALEQCLRGGRVPAVIQRHADRILGERPDAVGISVLYTAQQRHALCLAREIHRRAGHIPVILGGTVFNEGIPTAWKGRTDISDFIVVGGGEHPLVGILSGRADLEPVAGVVRLRGHGPSETLPANYDVDLDEIGPPDFTDLPLERYYSPSPVLPVATSRGCYWRRCAFCSHFRSSGQTWQQRSVAGVVDELRAHRARGYRYFYFVDSVVSPARFSHLADGIVEAGLDIRYYAMARAEKPFNGALLAKAHRSGCLYVLWGFESGCQRVLDLMDKGTTVADTERILRLAAEAGLRNHVFTIFGFPTETVEEAQETLDFLERNRPWLSVVHRTRFALEEYSIVHRHPERFSITAMRPKPTARLFDFDCASGMTRAELEKVFVGARPFLRSFSGHPSVAGDFKFREHCLLSYAHEDDVRSAPRPPDRQESLPASDDYRSLP